jgi:hypothetical protein
MLWVNARVVTATSDASFGVRFWSVVLATALAALYGRFDRSLRDLSWWRHYADPEARRAVLFVYASHATASLLASLVFVAWVKWFPTGTSGTLAVVGSAGAYAIFAEACFRAEAVGLGLGSAKAGVSLLRKVLGRQFERLDGAIDDQIWARIDANSDTTGDLAQYLREVASHSTSNSPSQRQAMVSLVSPLLVELRCGDQAREDAARIQVTGFISELVREQKLKLP